jgi:cysteine desulfurase/selenocysteine lyase
MNIKKIRSYFPILETRRQGYPLIYCDNGATTQKPQQVIDALTYFYTYQYASIHRGIYHLSEQATSLYESARESVARFISCDKDEVVFTSGATDGINFIARTWGEKHIEKGDVIITSDIEHHANILPWIECARKKGAEIKYIPVLPSGLLDYEAYKHMLDKKVKLVAVTHTSNILGTHTDIQTIVDYAHEYGARVMIDAAQSIAHQACNVRALKADFLVFSGHKVLAPTGIGVLYIARDLHQSIDPYKFGGGMACSVDKKSALWVQPPLKYEAGTPPIAQAIGLGHALDFITEYIPFDDLALHEAQLCARLIDQISTIKGLHFVADPDIISKNGHIVTFYHDRIHAHDIAAYLDMYNICVRAGHHCGQPLHKIKGIVASLRVSFYAYNTSEEVDFIARILEKMVSDLL